jgi:hypothetical protein
LALLILPIAAALRIAAVALAILGTVIRTTLGSIPAAVVGRGRARFPRFAGLGGGDILSGRPVSGLGGRA